MIDDWQDMATAPRGELVMICLMDCQIIVARQEEYEGIDYDSTPAKHKKMWGWFAPNERRHSAGGRTAYRPKAWRPLPFPPKHLYERKLTADILEKQVRELRGE